MSFEEFNLLVKTLSSTSHIPESSILDSVAISAELKFGEITSEEEQNLINKVKNRLIFGLYEMENHSYVTSRPDYKVKFSFDDVDMDYLRRVSDELEEEKLIEGNQNYTKLTQKGILFAKKLKGDFEVILPS